MMTSHRLDSGSPLTMLLIGQPTLRRRLRVGDMAAFDQRVQLKYAIPVPALTPAEADGYIRAHLAARRADRHLFSDDAVRVIHSHARGMPRAINRLAVTALLAACTDGKAIADEKPPAPPSPRKPPPRQTDHHDDTPSTRAPPGTRPAGLTSPRPRPP